MLFRYNTFEFISNESAMPSKIVLVNISKASFGVFWIDFTYQKLYGCLFVDLSKV